MESSVSPPSIDGEIRQDDLSSQLYSTDASIYKVHPNWVCIPRNTSDLSRVVEWCSQHDIRLTPRGSGTSLSGQAIGQGAVVDCSRHLDDVRNFDAHSETVTVQPGVILDHLNDHLGKHGYQFGPDVATSSRANLGGMIGNNSAGAHSIRYGHTSGHVEALRCVLSNGEQVEFKPVPIERADEIAEGDTLEAQLYDVIPELVRNHAREIKDKFPDIQRNSAGYPLDRFLDQLEEGYVDFTQLVCGSEGTLAVVKEADLNVVKAPHDRALLVLHCDTVLEAMRANKRVVREDPYAVELIDDMILELARESLEMSRKLEWVEGEPSALLVVELAEYPGGDPLQERLQHMESILRDEFKGPVIRAVEPHEQEQVWAVRKAGLPLLLGLPGNRKPTTFIEDTAVEPERLAEYVKEFQELVADHDTRAAFYGHSSVGCLHIRPLINLKDGQDVENMRDLARDAVDLVMEYNGTITGEHGAGRARSEWLERMYGSTIVELFCGIKETFDPGGILNPGNVVDSQRMTENLRFGDDYSTQEFETVQDFSGVDGFDNLVELCNGNGACRKEESGTMCPSYMVTSEEKDSTRGRANALRGLIDGDLDPDSLTDGTMEEVMDLCISCKGCKSECPTGVDMAPLKEEVMHKVNQEKGSSIRDRMFANIGPLARFSSTFQPFFSWMQKLPGAETITKSLLGIAPERSLPQFSSNPFSFKTNGSAKPGNENSTMSPPTSDSKRETREPVVLYVDTFNGYIDSDIARSAYELLDSIGYDVITPETPCCGRPMMSKGYLDRAKQKVRENIDVLYSYARKDIPIIGLEPSCVSTFTDDYPRYSPGKKSETLAQQTQLFSSFLSERVDEHSFQDSQRSTPNLDLKADVLIHGHCHQKALYGTTDLERLFERLTSGDVSVIDSGCCGMAGSFGFEAEHYEDSKAMGERKLIPAVERSDENTVIIAEGTSCRQQISELSNQKAFHPANFINRNLM
ncbi:MAG: FAD-binding and (Fe-S)-binding domain-containing protein [bacterium]